MAGAYRKDLAYIHDAGFGKYALNAAPVLLDALRRSRLKRGLVIELGCGSGILSEQIAAAGYDVLGIDLSTDILTLARQRVPGGTFRAESLLTAELPSCVGVAAIGECVNYLFDSRSNPQQLARLFRRVYAALVPGGWFLFDSSGPGRVPGGGPLKMHFEGDDWTILVTVDEDKRRQLLTRRITTFRKVGEHYRRDHEIHHLRLYPPVDLVNSLRRVGFRVRTLRRYGPQPLPPGLVAFAARKPG